MTYARFKATVAEFVPFSVAAFSLNSTLRLSQAYGITQSKCSMPQSSSGMVPRLRYVGSLFSASHAARFSVHRRSMDTTMFGSFSE